MSACRQPVAEYGISAVIRTIQRKSEESLSLDVTMNHIRDIVSYLQIKGKEYGFVVNSDSMITAHRNETLKGKIRYTF